VPAACEPREPLPAAGQLQPPAQQWPGRGVPGPLPPSGLLPAPVCLGCWGEEPQSTLGRSPCPPERTAVPQWFPACPLARLHASEAARPFSKPRRAQAGGPAPKKKMEKWKTRPSPSPPKPRHAPGRPCSPGSSLRCPPSALQQGLLAFRKPQSFRSRPGRDHRPRTECVRTPSPLHPTAPSSPGSPAQGAQGTARTQRRLYAAGAALVPPRRSERPSVPLPARLALFQAPTLQGSFQPPLSVTELFTEPFARANSLTLGELKWPRQLAGELRSAVTRGLDLTAAGIFRSRTAGHATVRKSPLGSLLFAQSLHNLGFQRSPPRDLRAATPDWIQLQLPWKKRRRPKKSNGIQLGGQRTRGPPRLPPHGQGLAQAPPTADGTAGPRQTPALTVVFHITPLPWANY